MLYPPHHVTYAPVKVVVATSNSFIYALTRKYIIWPWPWGQGHINVAHYSLHHVTYAPAKFKVAASNILDGDAFTIKYLIGNLT